MTNSSYPKNNRDDLLIRSVFCVIVLKLKEDGVSYAEIQRRGNDAYQRLSQDERVEYERLAANANENLLSSGSISKEKMVRRIITNIETNVSVH